MTNPPLAYSTSNVNRSFQSFDVSTNGSPVSQIQLLQCSLRDASSNIRNLQSPIISTDSPSHSQNHLSSTRVAHVNSLQSTSLPLPSQPTLASGYISRAKLFNILDNYVQKSEFPRLLDRYEKLKRKISRDSTAFEDDEYYQSVELLLLLIVLLWLVHDSCCVCFILSFLLYLSLVPLIRRYYCMENVFVS